ncbi:hypothetical protein [Actinomadura nitritigenes]|uniref:hypothetical protein n=1 Tax=Actinomadura nitritigenes TaxID=134602 RepID=UPI003D8E5E90
MIVALGPPHTYAGGLATGLVVGAAVGASAALSVVIRAAARAGRRAAPGQDEKTGGGACRCGAAESRPGGPG